MYARVNRSFRDLFELTPERFADINRKLNAYVTECDAPEAKAAAKPRAKRRTPANKAKAVDNK